jgi:hypothetical protein
MTLAVVRGTTALYFHGYDRELDGVRWSFCRNADGDFVHGIIYGDSGLPGSDIALQINTTLCEKGRGDDARIFCEVFDNPNGHKYMECHNHRCHDPDTVYHDPMLNAAIFVL